MLAHLSDGLAKEMIVKKLDSLTALVFASLKG